MASSQKPPPRSLSVSNDGMLTAEATGYTVADTAPDMIEGWRGATLTNAGGDTAVVYSDIGNDGTVSLLNRYVSNLPGTGKVAPEVHGMALIDDCQRVPNGHAAMRPDEIGPREWWH